MTQSSRRLGAGLAVVLCLGVAPRADALLVAKTCSMLLAPVRLILRKTMSPTRAVQTKLAQNPAAVLDEADLKQIAAMTPFDQALTAGLREGTWRGGLNGAVAAPRLIPALARRYRVGRRSRVAYRYFLLTLFLAGAVQPYVMDHTVTMQKGRAEPAADEFELVSGGIHAWVRVGGHNYDYMDSNLRKDASGIRGDLEIRGTVVVRFKVTAEAVRAMQDDLERNLGDTGPMGGYPFVGNNCISDILRVIKRNTAITVPAGINRSPNLTVGYFKILKAMEDPRVVDIIFDERIPGMRPSVRLVEINETLFAALFFSNNVLWSQLDP